MSPSVPMRQGRAGIFSWMLFDWAAQPFFTLIITFTYAPYFTGFVADNPVDGQAMWGLATTIAGLIIAVLAPVLGALADTTGRRKPWIAGFSVLAIAGSALLYFGVPGPDAPVTPVLVAFVIGLIGVEFATVFTNAMMPSLVPRSDLGKLSGSAWALGYVGGLLALGLVLVGFSANEVTGKTLFGIAPFFGMDALSHEGDRATGPLTAIWYLVFILPLLFFTPDGGNGKGRPAQGVAFGAALGKLWTTIKSLRERRSYFAFLVVSMIYRDGLNALYAFGGIYAAGVLRLSIIEIGVFGIIAATAGALGAFLGGRLDARYGPRHVVFWSCWLLVLASTAIVSTTPEMVFFFVSVSEPWPLVVFYLAGSVIGAAGGALQAASRTLLVDQVAPEEATEAFGLYALTGRATSFLTPFLIFWVTSATMSQRAGITPVIFFLGLGALGLFFVRERRMD